MELQGHKVERRILVARLNTKVLANITGITSSIKNGLLKLSSNLLRFVKTKETHAMELNS